MNARVVNTSKNALPSYQTEGASGVDLYANLAEPVTVTNGTPVRIPTGIYIEIPEGYEAQIRSRSGLALNAGVFCLNSPGTIDSDYRGEVGVILANVSDAPFVVRNGDRIAQMVFAKVERARFVETQTLSESARGEGGFGHTGIANTNH